MFGLLVSALCLCAAAGARAGGCGGHGAGIFCEADRAGLLCGCGEGARKAAVIPHSATALDTAAVGQALGIPRDQVRVRVHRLRGKFREVLMARIAATLHTSRREELEEEMRALLAALHGHFERIVGSWADVDVNLPDDPPPDSSPEWS